MAEMRGVRGIMAYFADQRLSEAALLQKALESRDREDPDWDATAHKAALRASLKRGADRDHLVRLYGKQAVIEAEVEKEGQDDERE